MSTEIVGGNTSSSSSGGLQGTWDASTNTPTLANTDTGKTGVMYQVSVGGTVDFGAGNITFEAKDIVINNGTVWDKVDATDAVISVNSQTGAVVLDADDIDDTSTTNKFTTATDISKLSGIEDNAEVNPTDAEIKTAYENNSDTNAYTDTEKTKLSNIEANATANPNAFDKVTDDLDDISEGTTNKQFTSTLKNKLDNIEANAEVNPSDAEIKASVDNELTGSVVGTTDTQTITNKTIDANSNTITNLSKSDVGLSNVANTDTTNASNISSGTLNANRLPSSIDATKIADGSISNTEFQYLNGVTSNIQTQLDGAGGFWDNDVSITADETTSSTSYVDTNLSLSLPSAGVYIFNIVGACGNGSGQNTTLRMNYSGTTTQFTAQGVSTTFGGDPNTDASNAIANSVAENGGSDPGTLFVTGMIKVSDTGTFKMQMKTNSGTSSLYDGTTLMIKKVS